ncbi:potassium channel family protein [Humibacter albus]|uniref:potassium channel family protein n=1 Tax=Humibacter albus TaxID=427754 RepID=UPI0003B6BEC1|nr:potassium channel family protein [Humibacter albus]
MPATATADRLAAREHAVAQWERISTWPFLVLSVAFIVIYSIRCLDAEMARRDPIEVKGVLMAIWVIFIVDYVARLALSTDRRRFVRHNIPDLLAALVPVFRPFRAITALQRVKFFRARTGAAVRARLVSYSVAFVVLWVYTISVTVVAAERGAHGATIRSLGDALYWSAVTISTVGYGDMVPVTTTGRVLAVLLMLSGIVIVGVTTATVVSYISDAARHRSTGPHDEEGER